VAFRKRIETIRIIHFPPRAASAGWVDAWRRRLSAVVGGATRERQRSDGLTTAGLVDQLHDEWRAAAAKIAVAANWQRPLHARSNQ
jgi:hypothetical protein